MNALLKTEVKQLQGSFTHLPEIIMRKNMEDGDDCDWIEIRFGEKSSGHLFLTDEYPCRYVTVYPPDRFHLNKEKLELEMVFFTSDRIGAVVEQMILEYMHPSKKLSIGSNFHKSFLKTKQARSIYDQYLAQAERPGDHDGVYRVTFTDRRNVYADNNAALRALKYDHEKIFGLTNLPNATITGDVLTIKGWPWTKEGKKKALEDLDRCVATLLQDTEGKPDMKRAEIVYDRIVAMRNVHTKEPEDYDFIGPVQRGCGCCSGYAKLLKHAFNAAGLPCVVVYGDNHAWNLALIKGKLMSFDAMWEQKNGGKRYFALTVDEMAKDHTLDDIFFKENSDEIDVF